MLHHYEEPLISGEITDKGSGAIFFAGCNLKCCYCQNHRLSHDCVGDEYTVDGLVEIIKDLEQQGAYNINFVTPTHYTDQIIAALDIYRPSVPIVWNSSGYEAVETIVKLKDYVDIYLVDMKYASDELGLRYSKVSDYVMVNRLCIDAMRQNQPMDIVESGLMKKGVIIRHLILPNHTDDSVECLRYIHDNWGEQTIVSIMSQYEPLYKASKYPEINRKITKLEYKRVVSQALRLNMMNCFVQDTASADSKYIPDFK